MSEQPASGDTAPPTQSSIAGKSMWTLGTYVGSTGIRFASNIVLSRLFGPEVLGIVVIAQAIRTGCDLLTDLGPQQNIVHSPHGDDERFLNSLWTLQILRGLLVSLACFAIVPFLADFYRVDWSLLVAISLAPLLTSLMSTSLGSMMRRMEVKQRNLFELAAEAAGLAINIGLALWLRNVWAPILGILFSIAFRSAMTYFLPRPRHRLLLDKGHVLEIWHFSKWIMLSSLSLYAAAYVDRLFLGRVVSLATLGVYGLARSVAELPNTVAGRLSFQIIFPFVAKHKQELAKGSSARAELGRMRVYFLLLVVAGIGTVMAWSDWAVQILYGRRYLEAGWMLCLLLTGSWIAVLASLNEAIVFGRGESKNVGFANAVRFVTMGGFMAVGYQIGGLAGALLAIPASEAIRYFVLLRAQIRLNITFLLQDMMLTFGLLGVVAGWIVVRGVLGMGVPWALMG